MTAEAEQVVARLTAGGKSELQRARRSVTQSPGNGKESATERETAQCVWVRVKRCPDLSGSVRQGRKVRAHQCPG